MDTSLAIDNNDTLWAWGGSAYGQVGDGNTTNRSVPVKIKDGTKFKSVAAGKYHSLAIDEDDNLWAWGRNNAGQIGDGSTDERYTPVKIKNGTKFKSVYADYDISLAIDESDKLWSWGYNGNGQFGIGTSLATNLNPIAIRHSTTFKFTAISENHSLSIDTNGSLYVAGRDVLGATGTGVGDTGTTLSYHTILSLMGLD